MAHGATVSLNPGPEELRGRAAESTVIDSRADTRGSREDSRVSREDTHGSGRNTHGSRKDSRVSRKDTHGSRKDAHCSRKDIHCSPKEAKVPLTSCKYVPLPPPQVVARCMHNQGPKKLKAFPGRSNHRGATWSSGQGGTCQTAGVARRMWECRATSEETLVWSFRLGRPKPVSDDGFEPRERR